MKLVYYFPMYLVIVAGPLGAGYLLAQQSLLRAAIGLTVVLFTYGLLSKMVTNERDYRWLLVGGGTLSYVLGWVGSYFF